MSLVDKLRQELTVSVKNGEYYKKLNYIAIQIVLHSRSFIINPLPAFCSKTQA
jgi:hypothetical protein